ncbi:EYxxD motif small membrane protein [Neobacillus endophyticus]
MYAFWEDFTDVTFVITLLIGSVIATFYAFARRPKGPAR